MRIPRSIDEIISAVNSDPRSAARLRAAEALDINYPAVIRFDDADRVIGVEPLVVLPVLEVR